MKILVTGHMGKIGQHLLPALILANHEVRGSDRKSGGDVAANGWIQSITGDWKPDVILDLASGGHWTMRDAANFIDAKLVVAAIAGRPSTYAAGRFHTEGNVVVLGLSTVYGPRMGGAIGRMIEQEALSRPDNQNPRGVDIVNGGSTMLDFIHISDVTRAFVEALGWEPGYYEVATGIESSVWDAFRLLTFQWGYTPKKNPVSAASYDPIEYPHTTHCDLPWTPISLDSGLTRTVAGL